MSKQNGAATVAHNGNGAEPALTTVEDFTALRLHGKVTRLESTGRVVHWRPVRLARMLKAGKVPEHLIALVTSLVWTGKDESRTPLEEAIEWQDYLDWVSAACLLRPTVAYGPDATGDILPEDLEYSEQMELELLSRRPLEEVRPFRAGQDAVVEPGAEGERREPIAE